ncbi:glycosyltransferase [Cylindrospermopsis raciborskii]|nr:glycosyltransferase [Cylindrospermopsis raciborskii]
MLYHYGGFYLDMDVESVKPLDNLLIDNFYIWFYR